MQSDEDQIPNLNGIYASNPVGCAAQITVFIGLLVALTLVVWICMNLYDIERIFIAQSAYNFTGAFSNLVGPFISFLAAVLVFTAFREQYRANEQQKADLIEQRNKARDENFENNFFELIKLHRDNISELTYLKYDGLEYKSSQNRRVFQDIFNEFVECYREVKKFSNSTNPDDYIHRQYKGKLEILKKKNHIRADIIQIAIIDIAYSIVFFGLEIEGMAVLRHRFSKRYNMKYYLRLLAFIKLKPKRENLIRYQLWEYIRGLDLKDLRPLIDEVYEHRILRKQNRNASFLAKLLLTKNDFERYYGGQQHRLGHYFRHLFQSYKLLYINKYITKEQKYLYGKTLRAQLSTHEQALILINSISSLGRKWEYNFASELNENSINVVGLITTFHLIKNLPGNSFYDINYREFYPNVKYENNEE